MKKSLLRLLSISGMLVAMSATLNAQWTRNAVASQTYLTNTNDKLGIGTTTPSFKIDVLSSSVATINLKSTGGNANVILDRNNSSSTAGVNYRTNGIQTWQAGTLGGDNFVIKNVTLSLAAIVINYATNKVGIGTGSPKNTLSVNGTADFTGSVGIGTKTPAALLDVKGDVLINDILVGRGNGNNQYNLAFGANAVANADPATTQLTGVGYNALNANTTGSSNTAVGFYALALNTSGIRNSGIGTGSLSHNTTGSYNAAVGTSTVYDNVTGSYNTGLGAYSLGYNTTGSNNTALGAYSGVAGSGYSGLNNYTAVGSFAYVDASNKVLIGNGSVSSIGGQVGWTTYSDQRIKDNVQENIHGLDFINALRPVTFHYNVDKQNELMGIKKTTDWNSRKDIEKMEFSGFLAQEVDAAAIKVGYNFSGIDKSGKILGLRYAEFVVPLVKAVQELNAENKELKIKNQTLENRLNEMQQYLATLSIANSSIKTENSQTATIASNMLIQNQPNPFNEATVIKYKLSSESNGGKIIIRDLSGNLVKQVSIPQSGKGQVTINSNELSPGTYTYTLEINSNSIDTKLMVVTK